MKILVADDDPLSRKLLRNYLERWGHSIVCAEDGAKAWELFRDGAFEIVVTDWMMPGLDGPSLVRRIRETLADRYVYTILLTAKARKDEVVEGMEAGADDFVTKPYDRDELHARIRAGERIVSLEHALAAERATAPSSELVVRCCGAADEIRAIVRELVTAGADRTPAERLAALADALTEAAAVSEHDVHASHA
jgi:DNA-binding response OmpR family regulator